MRFLQKPHIKEPKNYYRACILYSLFCAIIILMNILEVF
jgi:hypothetical protein